MFWGDPRLMNLPFIITKTLKTGRHYFTILHHVRNVFASWIRPHANYVVWSDTSIYGRQISLPTRLAGVNMALFASLKK